MDKTRYAKLSRMGCGLTTEEVRQGWHFCGAHREQLFGPPHKELYGDCGCTIRVCDFEASLARTEEKARERKGPKPRYRESKKQKIQEACDSAIKQLEGRAA